MPPPLLGVVGGQQDLRDGDAVARERLLIGVREPDLPGRRGGLLFLEPEPPSGEAELPPADRDRAGRHEDHLLAAGPAAGDVVGQRRRATAGEPRRSRRPTGRADLHDEPPSLPAPRRVERGGPGAAADNSAAAEGDPKPARSSA